MKPQRPIPALKPSQPGNDPHPSTEEIGKDEMPDAPRQPNDRRQLELEQEQRVNNAVHDGAKFLNR